MSSSLPSPAGAVEAACISCAIAWCMLDEKQTLDPSNPASFFRVASSVSLSFSWVLSFWILTCEARNSVT